jgi:hypothetical protein
LDAVPQLAQHSAQGGPYWMVIVNHIDVPRYIHFFTLICI